MAQAGKAFAMRPAVLAPLLKDKQAAAALAAYFDVELAVAPHECDAEVVSEGEETGEEAEEEEEEGGAAKLHRLGPAPRRPARARSRRARAPSSQVWCFLCGWLRRALGHADGSAVRARYSSHLDNLAAFCTTTHDARVFGPRGLLREFPVLWRSREAQNLAASPTDAFSRLARALALAMDSRPTLQLE